LIYLTTSGSNCLQTAQSQLTVIQVPRHGEFALLSWTCTDYMPVTGSTSRNRPNPYRPLYTCMRTDRLYMGCEINPSDQGGGCYSTL